jgi:hypothetical protein
MSATEKLMALMVVLAIAATAIAMIKQGWKW